MVKTAYYAESDAPGELYRMHRWEVEEFLRQDPDEDGRPWLFTDLMWDLIRRPGARIFGHDGEITDLVIRVDGRYHYFADYDYGGTFGSLRAATRFVRAAIYANGESDPKALLEEDYCGLPRVCLLPKWPWIRRVFETLEFPTDELTPGAFAQKDQAWDFLGEFREKFLRDGLPQVPPGVPTDIRQMEHAPWDCPRCGAKAIGQGAELWCTNEKCGNRYPRWVRKEV